MVVDQALVERMRFPVGSEPEVRVSNVDGIATLQINGQDIIHLSDGKSFRFNLRLLRQEEPVGLIRGLFGWLW